MSDDIDSFEQTSPYKNENYATVRNTIQETPVNTPEVDILNPYSDFKENSI